MHSEVASIYFVVVAERPPELALDQPRHPYGRQGDEPGPIDVVVIGYPPGAPITGERFRSSLTCWVASAPWCQKVSDEAIRLEAAQEQCSFNSHKVGAKLQWLLRSKSARARFHTNDYGR
jgi:hypothetical protein